LISELRKDISEMGWEIKNLQKSKETLKHDVEKLEKEIFLLESQKKSVNKLYETKFSILFLRNLD
jgi:chromosome segregation ATPase